MIILEFIRHERDIGQPALAKRSGVSQPTISLIETGRLNPTPEELEKLGRALGVPPEHLMRKVEVGLTPEGDAA